MGKKLVFKKKAQLLRDFASVADLYTRFEQAGFHPSIRNREHNFVYHLTENGFDTYAFLEEELPEPELGKIDVDVSKGFAKSGLVAIEFAPDVPSELAKGLFPKTECMFGPEGADHRMRVYKVSLGSGQFESLHFNVNTKGVTVAEVRRGHNKEKIWVPPGCNGHGQQLTFATDCADAPTEVASDELLTALRKLEIAARLVHNWPSDLEDRAIYSRNCARLFAGIGLPNEVAVESTRQCAAWANDQGTAEGAGLAELDDLVPLGEAKIKSLCADLWGPGGLKLGEKFFGWFKSEGAETSELSALKITENGTTKLSDGFVLASEIQTAKLEWLWESYIPKGAVTMIDGLPGEGKSTLTCDIAARVSAGISFPDGVKVEPRVAVMINGEDFAPQVAIPRIQAAGGDPGRTIIWPDPGAEFAPLHLPDKLSGLKKILETNDVGLIVIDPLNSHLSPKHKVENDQHVKAALQPLTKMAQDKGISILAVRHLTKVKTGLAVTAGLGSIGIIASARSGFIVAPEPDGSGDKILACAKINATALPPSLRFRIVPATVKSSSGEDITTSKIEWLGESSYTGNDLCKPDKGAEGSVLEEAVAFLQEVLAEEPRAANDVKSEAKEAGISVSTLNRAKTHLGIKPKKTPTHWEWELPKPKE